MGRLQPDKLHIKLSAPTGFQGPVIGRCYTLTHSDLTGDLFLTIGPDFDKRQVSGPYTRLMRDEVLAEWKHGKPGPVLHVHCHVSGGLALGPARMRYAIFKRELPLALEALRFGDRGLFEAQPTLGEAPVVVHFHATQRRYNRFESWGVLDDYSYTG